MKLPTCVNNLPRFHIFYYYITVLLLPLGFYINYDCDCYYNLYADHSFIQDAYYWAEAWLLYVIFSVLFIGYLNFFWLNRKPLSKVTYVGNRGLVDIFFLTIAFLYLYAMLIDVATVKSSTGSSRAVELLMAFFQPYFLILLYLYSFIRSRTVFYWFILLLYIVGSFYSGFLLGLMFYIAPLFFLDILKIKLRYKFLIFLLLLSILFIYKILKWLWLNEISVSDFSEFAEKSGAGSVGEYYFWINLSKGIISRFDVASSIALYNSKFEYQISLLSNELRFSPIFQGYIGSLFYKLFVANDLGSLNSEINYLLYSSDDSYLVFPLPMYFKFGFFYGVGVILYAIAVISTCMKICNYLPYKRNLWILCSIVFYITVFPGWFWALLNFAQSLLLFAFVMLFVCGYKKGSIL